MSHFCENKMLNLAICVSQEKASGNATGNIHLLPNNVCNAVSYWSTADHQPMIFPVWKQCKLVLKVSDTDSEIESDRPSSLKNLKLLNNRSEKISPPPALSIATSSWYTARTVSWISAAAIGDLKYCSVKLDSARACVRACVRACGRAGGCVRACVRALEPCTNTSGLGRAWA